MYLFYSPLEERRIMCIFVVLVLEYNWTFMVKRSKFNERNYYICLIKESNKVYISSTKTFLASLLGICTRTITRHLSVSPIFETNKYTIWDNNIIHIAQKRKKKKRKY